MISRFVANSEKCLIYKLLGGSAQIVTILHRGYRNLLQYYMGGGLPNLLRYYIGGVIEIYYNITWGGSSQFITILQWGGVSRDPKFVLRNIWTAPKTLLFSAGYLLKCFSNLCLKSFYQVRNTLMTLNWRSIYQSFWRSDLPAVGPGGSSCSPASPRCRSWCSTMIQYSSSFSSSSFSSES